MSFVHVMHVKSRVIKGSNHLEVCVCCGQGIRRVAVMSNGWTFGIACMKKSTIEDRGVRFLSVEAFNKISGKEVVK